MSPSIQTDAEHHEEVLPQPKKKFCVWELKILAYLSKHKHKITAYIIQCQRTLPSLIPTKTLKMTYFPLSSEVRKMVRHEYLYNFTREIKKAWLVVLPIQTLNFFQHGTNCESHEPSSSSHLETCNRILPHSIQ